MAKLSTINLQAKKQQPLIRDWDLRWRWCQPTGPVTANKVAPSTPEAVTSVTPSTFEQPIIYSIFPTANNNRNRSATDRWLTSSAEQDTGLSVWPGFALRTAAFPEVRLREAQIKEVLQPAAARHFPRARAAAASIWRRAGQRRGVWRHPGKIPNPPRVLAAAQRCRRMENRV